MAITLVQSRVATSQGSGASSFTFAFTSPVVYGNIGFVALGYTDNGVVPSTVVDDIGNTYSLLKRALGNSRGTDLWICQGLVAGTATVTVTFSGGKSGVGICLLEVQPTSGFILAIDQQNAASNAASVTSFPSGSITTTINAELILYVGRLNQTITTAAGYVATGNPSGSNSVTLLTRIVTATETTNPTPTGATGTGYGAMVVSLSEVADTSAIRISQSGREVTQVYDTDDVAVQITQCGREITYPFTVCSPAPPAPPASVQRPIRRTRRFPLPFDRQLWMYVSRVEIVMQQGIGLTTGQGSAPIIELRFSGNGGMTWGPLILVPVGYLGTYLSHRAVINQIGKLQNGYCEMSVSDPVAWAFLQCLIDAMPSNG